MGGRKSRVKGATGEREFFRLSNSACEGVDWPYRSRTGEIFFRHPAPRHGAGQPDNSDPHGVLPLTVEVKRVEKPQFKTWIDKLQDQARPHQTPVLAWRKNGEEWTVMPLMDMNEWQRYLKWKLEGVQHGKANEKIGASAQADQEPEQASGITRLSKEER